MGGGRCKWRIRTGGEKVPSGGLPNFNGGDLKEVSRPKAIQS